MNSIDSCPAAEPAVRRARPQHRLLAALIIIVGTTCGSALGTAAWAQPPIGTVPSSVTPGEVVPVRITPREQPRVGSLSLPRVLPMTTSARPDVWHDLFAGTWSDAKRLPSKPTLKWLSLGAVAAAATRPADAHVGRSLSTASQLHEVTESGAYIGSTPIQLGLSAMTYTLGRVRQSERMTAVGAELFRAELLAEGVTLGFKEAVRRRRPEGSGFAFPSGHTTVSFASATVLQQNFGWRVGAPAYALASFVALSRVQMKRHYLSDVAFGAALGVALGRTVSFGPRHAVVMTPTVVDGGGGVQFIWTR